MITGGAVGKTKTRQKHAAGTLSTKQSQKQSPHLNVEAPEVLVVVELLGRRELSPENVQVISEERRLVGTPWGGGVGRLDMAPLVLLDVPPGRRGQRTCGHVPNRHAKEASQPTTSNHRRTSQACHPIKTCKVS